MTLRVAVAQLSSVAGGLKANGDAIIAAAWRAAESGADVLLTPEMALTGYPVEDLLGEESFLDAVEGELRRVAAALPQGVVTIIGAPVRTSFIPRESPARATGATPLDATPRTVRNALVVVAVGRVVAVRTKALLPTTSVFDDSRWMLPGVVGQGPVEIRGVRVGLLVCEDVWGDSVAESLVRDGAELLLVANASPYDRTKTQRRRDIVMRHIGRLGVPIVYCNAVGGQDEVVFDGGSFIADPVRGTRHLLAPFEESVAAVDFTPGAGEQLRLAEGTQPPRWPTREEEIVYSALVLGLGDYVRRNGFSRVVLGLSGGLDSALAATIAVDALGPESVVGIGMPGPYSSAGSVDDARDLAARLGIEFHVVPIRDTFEAELALLGDLADGPGAAVARENIQARLRALHLMTYANAQNGMLVNTGNRSEAAVGYFTLGGDSSGGFAPLKDVPKTLAYQLCEWRNEYNGAFKTTEPPIPVATIRKPPSAELAPDQNDIDSLPPYDILDFILERYLEEMEGPAEILDAMVEAELDLTGYIDSDEGLDGLVLRVLRMVDRAEHKRRQVAPGIKLTRRAFGRDRRVPITNWRRHTVDNA